MAFINKLRSALPQQPDPNQAPEAPTQPQTVGQMVQSPALAAMKGYATPGGQAGTQAGAMQQPGTPAPEPQRTDLVTPQKVDTTAANGTFNQALDANTKAGEQMTTLGQNAISNLQRRNASLSAMSGASVGGGSYLGGQRAALSQGMQGLSQNLLQNYQARQGILGNQAGMQYAAASQNASLGQQGRAFNASREGSVQDRTAGVEAEHGGKAVSNDVTEMTQRLKGVGVDLDAGTGFEASTGRQLLNAIQSAPPDSPEYKKAYDDFNTWAGRAGTHTEAEKLWNKAMHDGGQSFTYKGTKFGKNDKDKFLTLKMQEAGL